MTKSSIWTILGVIVAVAIAWWLVNVIFALVAFAFKLLIVAGVAVIVFFAIRAIFSRRDAS